MNLASLLGVDASELLKAKGTAESMARDLRRIAETLEADHGIPAEGSIAPVRSRVPHIEVVTWARDPQLWLAQRPWAYAADRETPEPVEFGPGDGRRQRVEIETATGRPSPNGTTSNIGDSLVLVRYLGTRDEWSRYAELPPGSTIEHLWTTRTIELISLGHEAGKVQVIAR